MQLIDYFFFENIHIFHEIIEFIYPFFVAFICVSVRKSGKNPNPRWENKGEI